MCDLLVCRVCLATDDVKLYNIYKYNLIEAYKNITGDQLLKAEDGLPEFICSYCSTLLLKYVAFKEKCCDTRSILTYASQRQLTTNDIRSINQQYKLPYTISTNYPTINMENTEYSEPVIKEESIVIESPLIMEYEAETKKKKVKKKKEKINTDLIKFEDEVFNDVSFEGHDIDVNDDAELKDIEVNILTKEEQLLEIEERKTSSNYVNSFYKCDFCYKGFIMASTYRNHMTKHDPERGDFVCEVCKSRWADARSLRAHVLNTHEKKYVCKLCEYVSRNIHRAKEHLKWHKGFMFECKICGALFAKSTSHLTHIRLQHPSSHACELCGESFIGEFGLRMHKKKVHQNADSLTSQCENCSTKFHSVKAMKRHLKLSKDDICDSNIRPCQYCGDGFETEDALKQHLKDNHEDESLYCEECARSFTSARSLCTHRERVHLGVKRAVRRRVPKRAHDSAVCEVCGLTCISKATLMYHQRTHTGEKPYHCTQCPKKFSIMQLLQIHIRTHTGERPFKCQNCPKAFKHKAALNRHNRVHTGVKPYSCPHCNKSFTQSNSMKYHINTVHLKLPAPYRNRRNKLDVSLIKHFAFDSRSNQLVICGVTLFPMSNMFYCSFVSIHYIICECGDTFPTEEALKEHLEKEHTQKVELERNEYKCDTCDKIFASEKACLIHQRIHTNPKIKKERDAAERRRYYSIKNIVCEVCGKRYASNAALRYHQRVHTGERPYQCTECPKNFTMPLFLQIHMRTHTGERPYECPQCPKAFSNKAALLRHDRVHTGIKPYECPQCGKFFTQSNSMKLHVKTVHLKMPAPYKSRNRRAKQTNRQAMNVEVQIEEGIYQPQVKTELKEYETDGEIYQGDVYQEVYQDGDMLYEEVKVEGSEIAMYANDDEPEVLYEEVYEIEEV
nr:zinc finger protein 709-like [Vanessa tameamea]